MLLALAMGGPVWGMMIPYPAQTHHPVKGGLPGKRVPAVFRIKTTRLFSKHRTGEGEKERCEIKELVWLTLTCGSSRALTQFCHGCFASVSGLHAPSRFATFWFPPPWLHTRRLTVSSSSPPTPHPRGSDHSTT